MRFAVEAWAPEYGTPVAAGELEPVAQPPETDHELPASRWAPLRPDAAEAASRVRFVDGVRRIDAWLWITDEDGAVQPGIAASYAAGSVCCGPVSAAASGVEAVPRGSSSAPVEQGVVRGPSGAWVEQAVVRRRVVSPAATLADVATRHGTYEACQAGGSSVEALTQELQQQMGLLEQRLALEGDPAELAVVDGPLSKLPAIGETVGYVKTRHREYLSPELDRVTAALRPGERTPLFRTAAGWQRWSWYLRLPGGGDAHPLAGVVRCELAGEKPVARARAVADMVAATLPRFASTLHRDARAPQNLTPIGALERALRHRLGDATLMERALRTAAAAPQPTA